jgi:hypothetical protein
MCEERIPGSVAVQDKVLYMIYVSGALQGSKNLSLARGLYEWIGRTIVDAGGCAYVPHLHTDPDAASHMSATDVHATDMRAIVSACAIVACLNEPSHGVGAEIAIAVSRGIPILPILRHDIRCSRFIEGFLQSSSVEIVRYDQEEDLSSHLLRFTKMCLAKT